MSILDDLINRGRLFAEEVGRLTTEAGADGQVPARDLANALEAWDAVWWQLYKTHKGSSGFNEDRAAVEAHEQFLKNGISIRDPFVLQSIESTNKQIRDLIEETRERLASRA